MKNKKLLSFKKVHPKEIFEYVYFEDHKMGYIYFDGEEYYFRPPVFFISWRLGKGKCLKEVAERLIELNYNDKKELKTKQQKRKRKGGK